MSTIIIILFRYVIFPIIKPFNMHTQGIDKENRKENEKEKDSTEKEKTEEEEDFQDVYEEETATKETIDSIENPDIIKRLINIYVTTERAHNFMHHNLNFFHEKENMRRGDIGSQQFRHSNIFQEKDTYGIYKKIELDETELVELYGNNEKLADDDNDDGDGKGNEDRGLLEDRKENHMKIMSVLNKNGNKKEKAEAETETDGKDERHRQREENMNEKSLFLKSLEEDVKYLNLKYESRMEESKKKENDNNPLKDIYEELENSKQNEKEHSEFLKKSSSNNSNRNSKMESDELFLKKIEYTSSNDTDNDVFSKEPFDMTTSAAHIWDNINKLEVKENKHDIKSVDYFSNFLKDELSSDDYDEEKKYVDYLSSTNLETEQMEPKKKYIFSYSTESEKHNFHEFTNSSHSKEFDEEGKMNFVERRTGRAGSSTSLKGADKNVEEVDHRVRSEYDLEIYKKHNTFEKENTIEREENKNLLQRNNVDEKEYHFDSDSPEISYARFSSTDEEEKEENKNTKTSSVVVKKSELEQKEKEKKTDEKMDKMGDEHNFTKLQNWISFRKNSINHFMTQQSISPHGADLKKIKRLETETWTRTRTRTPNETEKERKIQKEKDIEKSVKGEEKKEIDTGSKREDNKEEETNEERKHVKEEEKGKEEAGDTEVCVNFNDDEQWDEEDKKSERNNVNKGRLNKKVIKEFKQRKRAKEKIDITNTNNEKTKFEKIKLVTKKSVHLGNTKRILKKDLEEKTTGRNEENEELNTLGKELNKQIVKLEKEQEKVKKLEYELIAKSAEMELEREEMKNEIEKEKKKMMKTLEEERKKWTKEKKKIGEVEKQRNIVLNRKKLTNEIALYKNKIKELEETLEKEKKQHKIISDRLKKQVENLTKENEKIKMELKISEEYRIKLEKYQQKTILNLAKNVNEQHTRKSINYATGEQEEHIHINANFSKSKYQKKEEGKKKKKEITEEEEKVQQQSGISYIDELIEQSESEKSESIEIKKILNEKKSERFDELDFIYADVNSRNDTLQNALHIEETIKETSNDNRNKNEKRSLNSLFVHKNITKNEGAEKTKLNTDEEVEKHFNKTKPVIKKNEKVMSKEQIGNSDDLTKNFSTSHNNCTTFHEDLNINSTKKLNYSKQLFSESKDKNKNSNTNMNQYTVKVNEKEAQKEEIWEKSQFLNSYPYSKKVLMQNEEIKKKNYESMFENLNEKICVDNLSDQFSRKNVTNYENEPFYNDANNRDCRSREASQSEEKQAKHYSTEYLATIAYQKNNRLSRLESCFNTAVTNGGNINNECNVKNTLNSFGKDWTFLLNFKFEELFQKCENVMKSAFSLSNKIKYRQAFVDGKVETLFEDGLRIIEKNKNRKIIHPDNLVIHLFHNKDYKARLPNAYMLYHFASKGIYQVNIPGVCQLNKFPSGQIDCKYSDGHIQILFSDGKRKEILPNKEEYAFLINAVPINGNAVLKTLETCVIYTLNEIIFIFKYFEMYGLDLQKIGRMSTVNNTPLVNFFKKEEIHWEKEKQIELQCGYENNEDLLNHLEDGDDILPAKRKYLTFLLNFESLKKRKLENNEICIDHFKDMKDYVKEIKDFENVYAFIFKESFNKGDEDFLSVHRKFCNIKLGVVVDPEICFPNATDKEYGKDPSGHEQLQNSSLIRKKNKRAEEDEEEKKWTNIRKNETELENEQEEYAKGNMQKKFPKETFSEHVISKGDKEEKTENVIYEVKQQVTDLWNEKGKVIRSNHTLGKRYLQNSSNQFVYVDDLTAYETLLLLSFTIHLQSEQRYNEREEKNLEQLVNMDKKKLSYYLLRESYQYFFEEKKYQCNTCGLRFYTSSEKLDHIEAHYKMNKLNILNSDKMNMILLSKYKNKKVHLCQMNLPIEFFVCKRFTLTDDLYDTVVLRSVESSSFLNSLGSKIKREDAETEELDVKDPNGNNSYLVDSNKSSSAVEYSFENMFNFANSNNEIDTFFSASQISNERKKKKRDERSDENEEDTNENKKAEAGEGGKNDYDWERYINNTTDDKDSPNEDFLGVIYGNQSTYEVHLSKYYEMTVENNVILQYIEPGTMFRNIMKCLNIKDITTFKFPSWIPERSVNNFFVKRILEMEEPQTRRNYYKNSTQNEMDKFYNIYANEEEEVEEDKERQIGVSVGITPRYNSNKKEIFLADKQKIWLLTIPDDFYKKWKLTPLNKCWEAAKRCRLDIMLKKKMMNDKEDTGISTVLSIFDILKYGKKYSKEMEMLPVFTENLNRNKNFRNMQNVEFKDTDGNSGETDQKLSLLHLQDKTVHSFVELFNDNNFLLTGIFKQVFLFYLRKCYFVLFKHLKWDVDFKEFNIFEKKVAKYIFDTYTQKVPIFDINSGKIDHCFFCKERLTAGYSSTYRDFYYDKVVAVDMNKFLFMSKKGEKQKNANPKNRKREKSSERTEINAFPFLDNKNISKLFKENKECWDHKQQRMAQNKNEKNDTVEQMGEIREHVGPEEIEKIEESGEIGGTIWSDHYLLNSLNKNAFFDKIKEVINENCNLNKTHIEDYSGGFKGKGNMNKKMEKNEDYYDQLYRSGCIAYEMWVILKKEILTKNSKRGTARKKTSTKTHLSHLERENSTADVHIQDEEVKRLIKTFQKNVNTVVKDMVKISRINNYINKSSEWGTKDFKKILKTYIYDMPKRQRYDKHLIHYPLGRYIQVHYTYFHSICFKKYIDYFLLPYYFISKLCDQRFKEIIAISIDTFFKAYQKTCHFLKNTAQTGVDQEKKKKTIQKNFPKYSERDRKQSITVKKHKIPLSTLNTRKHF